MEGVSLIGFLIIGLIAGWLGGKIMRGAGFGFVGNLVVGIVGAFVGGFLFNALGITGFGFVGALVTGTVGAVVLLFIVGLIKRGWLTKKFSRGFFAAAQIEGGGMPRLSAITMLLPIFFVFLHYRL